MTRWDHEITRPSPNPTRYTHNRTKNVERAVLEGLCFFFLGKSAFLSLLRKVRFWSAFKKWSDGLSTTPAHRRYCWSAKATFLFPLVWLELLALLRTWSLRLSNLKVHYHCFTKPSSASNLGFHQLIYRSVILGFQGLFFFTTPQAKFFWSFCFFSDEFDVPDSHRSCASHLDELKRRGCLVLHGVDVYDMDRHDILKWWKFDVFIFNFPHAGHYPWLRERDNELIQ